MTLIKFILIFLGGGLGSVLRYAISLLGSKGFPFHTLAVNLIGAFIIGVVFALVENKIINESQRLLFAVGFLGGFTTFSTFAFEMHQMLASNEHLKIIVYLIASLVFGILLAYLGWQLGIRIKSF